MLALCLCLAPPQVNYWLGGLMEVKSNDLYRMKGVLAIQEGLFPRMIEEKLYGFAAQIAPKRELRLNV